MVWRCVKKKTKKKLGLKLPYDPAIPLLGIYPEETKIEKDTCIPWFTAALFTIAKAWTQPECPSTDEWIKKMYIDTYIYTFVCVYIYIYIHTHNGILFNHIKEQN